jgi:hypothetical protein
VSTGISLDNFTDNLMRLGKARSVFVVCNPGTTNNNYTALQMRRGNFDFSCGLGFFAANGIFSDGSIAISTTDAAPVAASTPVLAEWHSTGTTGSPAMQLSFITGGATRTLDVTTISKGDNGPTGFVVGSDNTQTYTFNGDIAEILVYDAKLGPIELAMVRGYLNNKYGL